MANSNILTEIFKSNKTDKFDHGYGEVYESYINKWTDEEIQLCEIGVDRGNSLRAWKEYFIKSEIIGFDLDKESVHNQLGKMYFNKEELTDDEYSKSKELTFKQLYGGVFKEYKEIPFFKAMNEYVEKLWELFNATEKLELVGGKILTKEQIQNPTPNKVLNYMIQSAETHNNVISVRKVIDYLDNKQSKVILYTYDSFLVDYSSVDGKEVLKEIKRLLENNKYVVKVAYGNNYNSLKDI